MLRVFFYHGNDKKDMEYINKLITEGKIKEYDINDGDIYIINPKYNNEFGETIDFNDDIMDIHKLHKMLSDNYDDYQIDPMEVETIYNKTQILLPISPVIENLTDGNNPEIYDFEDKIYNSDNPYKEVCNIIDMYGRNFLREEMTVALREINRLTFDIYREE